MSFPIEAVDSQFLPSAGRPVHSKIISSVRQRGWIATAFCGSLHLARRCKSLWYDLTHGVSTRHRVPISEMNLAGEAAAHALFYEASDTNCFRNLLRSLNANYSDFEFVDLGAGKGRTLLVAAEFPFRKIAGVELSPTLAETARH